MLQYLTRFIKALICIVIAITILLSLVHLLDSSWLEKSAPSLILIKYFIAIGLFNALLWPTNFSTKTVKANASKHYELIKKSVLMSNYVIEREIHGKIEFSGKTISKRLKWLFSEKIEITIIDDNNIKISGPKLEIKDAINRLGFLIKSNE